MTESEAAYVERLAAGSPTWSNAEYEALFEGGPVDGERGGDDYPQIEPTPGGRQPSLAGSVAKFSRTSFRATPMGSQDDDSVLITELRVNGLPDDETANEWEGMKILTRMKARSAPTPELAEEESGDEDWDTDLEDEDSTNMHDTSGRTAYREVCERLGVVPVSYFTRHISDQQLTMRYHGLGPVGTKAIAKVLRANVHIEKLNLAGNWMEAIGGIHIAHMLLENEYISELNLSDNKLGSVGGYHVAKTLNVNTALRHVDLAGNGFAETDAEYFAGVLEQNKFLKSLNISRNRFGELSGLRLGPAIGTNDVLEHLDLSWNEIRREGAVTVARGLKENIRIKTCNLSWNGFGPEGGAALADAIATNEALIELDISGNRLDIQSALLIAKAISTNEQLQILRIGNNPISTLGCIALAKSIKESEVSTLTCLDLKDIPVEYEFLAIVDEIRKKRPDFEVVYGSVMRSGNTPEDIGKRAVDPSAPKDPLLVLQEHLIVNDTRILDILAKFDPDDTKNVTPEQFTSALEELGVPYTREQLDDIAKKLGKNEDGMIYYGDMLSAANSARSQATNTGDVKEAEA